MLKKYLFLGPVKHSISFNFRFLVILWSKNSEMQHAVFTESNKCFPVWFNVKQVEDFAYFDLKRKRENKTCSEMMSDFLLMKTLTGFSVSDHQRHPVNGDGGSPDPCGLSCSHRLEPLRPHQVFTIRQCRSQGIVYCWFKISLELDWKLFPVEN